MNTPVGRRSLLVGGALAAAFTPGLAHAASRLTQLGDSIVSVRGRLRPLAFTMTLSSSGQEVTAKDFRSDAVLLYFGFTRCPDTCALTAYNAARLLALLGKDAAHVRFLFVTIDLAYDTVPILRKYLAEFGPPPGIDGLRGTPDALRALAKRYFVYYSAPTNPNSPDPVSQIAHGSGVYLFGRDGKAEDIISTMGFGNAPLHAIAAQVKKVSNRESSWF